MRCELRVTSGSYHGRRMWLRDGQTIQIGRTEYADLCIADDPLMSRVHFALDSDGGMLRIRDLGSRNGTYVNGQLVKIQELRHGDMIVAGQTRFDVVIESADESGSRADDGGSGVYHPGSFATQSGMPQGGPPQPNQPPQPGTGYPGGGVPTSVSGYGGNPPPNTPANPPYAMPPGDAGAALTQYPHPYPPAQNPAPTGPGSNYPNQDPGQSGAGYHPSGSPPTSQPYPPPNTMGGYPPTGSMPPTAPPHPPGQNPPAPNTQTPYPAVPPLNSPQGSRPTDSVFGNPPVPSGGQPPSSGHPYPPATGGNPPAGHHQPGTYPSHYGSPQNPPSQSPPPHHTPPYETPPLHGGDPHQSRHPGQSLYGAAETPPHELGSGTYQQTPPNSPAPPSPPSNTSQNPIEGDGSRSPDVHTPIQSSTPIEGDSLEDAAWESHHRTPFDENDRSEESSSPFGAAGEEARQDPERHSSPFDSSVTAAMQTLAGDFSSFQSADDDFPSNAPNVEPDRQAPADTPHPESPLASSAPDESSEGRSKTGTVKSPDQSGAPGQSSDESESNAETQPDGSQQPKVVGWSIQQEDIPKPPKTPNDSTANLVPKSVPTDKLPTQTIGNEIPFTDKEPTPYGTAVFDSSLEDSTLAYATFSSVFANVAYRESESEQGLRCFQSHGEKSSAADIAKSLSDRNQTYALVNVARLEESSRRVIDSNPNRSGFTQLIQDVILLTKSDPIDLIGLLRSNWGRDALILLTANLQKQKVLQELSARAHFFQQPSALSAELHSATPQDASKIFGGLEAFLLEGTEGKSWKIFLNPVFEGDWMRLGMPCPPVNDNKQG